MKKTVITFAVLAILFLNNSSSIRDPSAGKVMLLAHRGVHQQFSRVELGVQDCSASRISPASHDFFENTTESIDYAFRLGANVVEIDIHPTIDNEFVVFHDWRLECRTDGQGRTRDHKLDYLKTLDIAYGYSSDGGNSFPFRGKGVGQMPSLREVLDTFPDQNFLINIKSNDRFEAEQISEYLKERPPEDKNRLWFYGGEKPVSELLSKHPVFKGFTKKSIKNCLVPYIALGWIGRVPTSCKNTIIVVPKQYSNLLWGWPNLFVRRMEQVGTNVILVDTQDGHIVGINDPVEIMAIAERFRGIIWTDRIDLLESSTP